MSEQTERPPLDALRRAPLGVDVRQAAEQRIAWLFDTFPKLYVSFSAGKDSSVMLHLVMAEAERRKRKVGVLFVDLEAQYRSTIEHAEECFALYAEWIEPYWVALPLVLRNAVSQYEPRWVAWDPGQRDLWVREPPAVAVTDGARFPWFRAGMEFEELVEAFGHWYGKGEPTACLVGIRAQESLNRVRTLIMGKTTYGGRRWTTWMGGGVYNAYPLYDWKTEDVWRYVAAARVPYNRVYDLMHKAGLTVHQMRICQPYGDDQRKGLWLFHVLEPETWVRVVARVSGANTGALYANQTGPMMGRGVPRCPPGHTWESYTMLLLGSMPERSRVHYEAKIQKFVAWWRAEGTWPIPDEQDPKLEAHRKVPSWRRVAKALLKGDWWMKSLSFSQTKSHAYEAYLARVKKQNMQRQVQP